MTRVGVLTFHRAYNYGATLQAYALVRALHELGAEAEIIDYRSADLEEAAKLVKRGEGASVQTAAKVVFRGLKHARFDAFDRELVPRSPTVLAKEELSELAREYDVVIVGSDQVWNRFITGDDGAFFLDFAPDGVRRYSYAASFSGSERLAGEIASSRSEDLAALDGVSLREAGGISAIEAACGHPVRKDVDPVLLLEPEQWRALSNPSLCKKPYLFMYLVGQELHIRKFAESYAAARGLKLVDNKRSPEFLLHNGPKDFISWILNAEAVVTNSFHGAAFSVLLGKNAYFELAGGGSYNFRAKDLLDAAGIEGREIEGDEATDVDPPLDRAAAAARLEVLRGDSLSYLRRIVEGR